VYIDGVCLPVSQVIEEAKVRLRHEIQSRLDEAKEKGDYKAVLRFTRLFAPLGLQARSLSHAQHSSHLNLIAQMGHYRIVCDAANLLVSCKACKVSSSRE
jgi:hypothetical protein